MDDAPGLENIDMQSDTMSQLTQFTRYTAAPSLAPSMSTLSLGTRAGRAKAKKKEEKKKNAGKKGSVYEEAYLYDAVRKLVGARLGALQRQAQALLPVLVTQGATHRAAAAALQKRLLALEARAHDAADTLAARAADQEQHRAHADHTLAAAIAHLALQPGDEDAPGAALQALYAMRRAVHAPVQARVEVAREKWKLYLLDTPQAP